MTHFTLELQFGGQAAMMLKPQIPTARSRDVRMGPRVDSQPRSTARSQAFMATTEPSFRCLKRPGTGSLKFVIRLISLSQQIQNIDAILCQAHAQSQDPSFLLASRLSCAVPYCPSVNDSAEGLSTMSCLLDMI